MELLDYLDYLDCLRRWLSKSDHESPKMAFPNDPSGYGTDPRGWERLVRGRRKEPKLVSDKERKCLGMV